MKCKSLINPIDSQINASTKGLPGCFMGLSQDWSQMIVLQWKICINNLYVDSALSVEWEGHHHRAQSAAAHGDYQQL